MSRDIEDISTSGVGAAGATSSLCVPREGRRRVAKGIAEGASADGSSVGPGTVFVHTFGCGHNVSDGEYMAGQLAERGYRITDDFGAADAYLINSCTVKNPSEDHFVTMLRRARDTGRPVVVAGCVPQGDPANAEWSDVSVLGVRQIDRAGEAVDLAMDGNVVRFLEAEGPATRSEARSATSMGEGLPSLDMPKVRRNRFIEIIPINVGCLNNCTYCKTKHARGDLRSWPVAEVVARVRQVMAEGVREIRLTSEDTGAYGLDIGTNAAALMRALLPLVEGTTVMLRVGMSNPPYLLQQLDDFAEIMQHPNVYAFLHLPVQSGSNAVLDTMKREYTVEEFQRCVDALQSRMPEMSIATDIICAFPGEGDREWQETMQLCRHVRFPVLNISRFYARRGTPAAAMPQVPTTVSKQRSVELTNLYNGYRTYDNLVGTRHIFVSLLEVAYDKHHLVGHTKGFVQVLVSPTEATFGDCVDVVIVSATKFSVVGKVTANHGPLIHKSEARRTGTTSSSSPSVSSPAWARREWLPLVGAVVAASLIAWRFSRRTA